MDALLRNILFYPYRYMIRHFIVLVLLASLFFIACGQQPNSASNHSDTTKQISQQERPQQQIAKIDSALQHNENKDWLLTKKAQLFLQLQQNDSAIICFEQAIAQNKKNFDATIALAYLYAEQKNKKAIPLCLTLLKSDKEVLYAKAHYIQGVYFAGIGDIENATVCFNHCIKQDWTFIDAYLEQGILFLTHQRNDEALKIFTLAMKTNNKNPETYYWIGRTQEQKKDKAKAILYYKQSLLLDSTFAVARKRLQDLQK